MRVEKNPPLKVRIAHGDDRLIGDDHGRRQAGQIRQIVQVLPVVADLPSALTGAVAKFEDRWVEFRSQISLPSC
jgi:hypothetical protein